MRFVNEISKIVIHSPTAGMEIVATLGFNFVTPSSSLAARMFSRFRKIELVRNAILVGRPGALI